ncbi:MAG: DUF5666 domain-containing protein [bacterium]
MNKGLVLSRAISFLVLLIVMSTFSSILAQNSFVLSRNADFSTDDRIFDRTDTLYMKVTAPDVDFTDIDKNEFELQADKGGEKFEAAFDNLLNTTYTASLLLHNLTSPEVSWRWKARVRDDSGHDFRAEVEIEITDGSQPEEVEIKGSVETVGADFLVVKGAKIFVDAATQIEDRKSQPLTFGDLLIGINVTVNAVRRDDGSLLALLIQVKDRNKGEIEVKGVIDSVGTDHVIILGQTFIADANTSIEDKDKNSIALADLVVGQIVEVKAVPQADGTLLATRIRVKDESDDSKVELVGFIDALDDTSLTVSGVTFVVNSSTEIQGNDKNPITLADLKEGLLVEVEAKIQNDGTILATKIKVEDDVPGEGEVEVVGEIEVLGNQQLQVTGLIFLVDNNTQILDDRNRPIAFGDLQVGALVEIKGRVQADGSILAVRIKIEDRFMDEVEITGVIDSIGDSSLVVNGLSFIIDPNTQILDNKKNPISFADLAVGMVVEIRAEILADGVQLATKIKLEDRDDQKLEVKGAIDSLGVNSLLVADVLFAVDASTVILDNQKNPIDFSALSVGEIVEVKGVQQPDGTFLAREIKLEDALEDEIEVKGTIEALTGAEITVAGLTFSLTANTQVLNNNNLPISVSDLSVGLFVEIRGELLPGGSLLAVRIKIETDPQNQLEIKAAIDSIGTSSILVLEIDIQVDNNTVILDKDNIPIAFGDLRVGLFVELKANKQADGLFLASKIKVEDVSVLSGTLSDVGANALSLFNTQISTDDNTLVVGAFNASKTFADLAPGVRIEARTTTLADGSFLASRIKILSSVAVTGVADDTANSNEIPEKFALQQNYPNPFNPTTTIVFEIAGSASSQSKVTLAIYNILGQKVKTLVDRPMKPGMHTVQWDGKNSAGQLAPSGIYLYRLETNLFAETRSMILLK